MQYVYVRWASKTNTKGCLVVPLAEYNTPDYVEYVVVYIHSEYPKHPYCIIAVGQLKKLRDITYRFTVPEVLGEELLVLSADKDDYANAIALGARVFESGEERLKYVRM